MAERKCPTIQLTARLTVCDVEVGSSLFGIAPTDRSDTATMSGRMHYRVIADGTHRVGGMLRGKGDKSGRSFAWYFRADGQVNSEHGYTKALRVVLTEGSPLPSDGLLEVPEAQSATRLNGGTKTPHHSTDRSRPRSWTEPALRSTPAAGGGTSAARQWHTLRRSSLPISRVPAPVRLRSQCARTERPSLRQLHNAVQRIAEQLCRVVDELGTRSLPSALWDCTHITHPNVIRPCHAGHGRSDLKIKG